MNRREFIKSTLIALLPAMMSIEVKEKEVERIFEETKHLNDLNFETYIRFQANIYINNPRQCAIITDIGD